MGVSCCSLHFQNAAYGLPHQTEAGVFSAPPSERLDPKEHQYANPVFRTAAVSPSCRVLIVAVYQSLCCLFCFALQLSSSSLILF